MPDNLINELFILVFKENDRDRDREGDVHFSI